MIFLAIVAEDGTLDDNTLRMIKDLLATQSVRASKDAVPPGKPVYFKPAAGDDFEECVVHVELSRDQSVLDRLGTFKMAPVGGHSGLFFLIPDCPFEANINSVLPSCGDLILDPNFIVSGDELEGLRKRKHDIPQPFRGAGRGAVAPNRDSQAGQGFGSSQGGRGRGNYRPRPAHGGSHAGGRQGNAPGGGGDFYSGGQEPQEDFFRCVFTHTSTCYTDSADRPSPPVSLTNDSHCPAPNPTFLFGSEWKPIRENEVYLLPIALAGNFSAQATISEKNETDKPPVLVTRKRLRASGDRPDGTLDGTDFDPHGEPCPPALLCEKPCCSPLCGRNGSEGCRSSPHPSLIPLRDKGGQPPIPVGDPSSHTPPSPSVAGSEVGDHSVYEENGEDEDEPVPPPLVAIVMSLWLIFWAALFSISGRYWDWQSVSYLKGKSGMPGSP